MSEFEQKARAISIETYYQFKQAIETGKWPDGNVLTEKQRGIVWEAVLLYEDANVPEGQRIGDIDDQCKSKAVPFEDTQQITVRQAKTEEK